MRKNFKLLGAVAVAGVVATTGSAFTASNTVAADKKVGFGSTSVTGAKTKAMSFTADSAGDASKKDAIVYTLELSPIDTTTPGNAVATLKYGATTATNNVSCVIVASTDVANGTITCTADYNVVDLGVVQLVVNPA